MPTDLSPHASQGIIEVRDRAGTGLPFSKGLMATSILATGVETDVAYAIAADIERELREHGQHEIQADQLVDLATDIITRRAGSEVAGRYLAWRRAKRTGNPVFIVLGGAPGVGKSTVATRLAVRFGITRVVTTDTIREVLRTVIPDTVLPELHCWTFETARSAGITDAPLQAFHRQARAVGAATAAVASRLAAERRSAIFEGVHLLPGQFGDDLASKDSDAIPIEMLLTLADESLHEARLTCRLHGEPSRGGHRHMQHFGMIRQLQSRLQETGDKVQVPVYNVADPEDLTQRIVDQVVMKVRHSEENREVGAA